MELTDEEELEISQIAMRTNRGYQEVREVYMRSRRPQKRIDDLWR